MKKIISLMLFFILSSFFVAAHGEETFEEAEELIESKIGCDELTEDQLEIIGEYYMEQMHPENHEEMDEMMGGEGSESLREMHISMARSFYCGEYGMMGSGMMDMMMGRGMVGSGSMMDTATKDYDYKKQRGMMNMMGYYGFGSGFGFVFMILFWGLIIWLIVWIVMQATKKTGKGESAMEILKKRFAKGEISKKEFEKMKKELQ